MAMQARQYEGTVLVAEFYNPVSGTIPSTANNSGGNITVTLPAGSQAAPGDFVQIGAPAAWGPLLIQGTISAVGQVQIAYRNDSGSTVNVGAQNFSILIERALPTGN